LERLTGLACGTFISNVVKGGAFLLSEEKLTISLANLFNDAARNFEL
jgi:hypothetical protein